MGMIPPRPVYLYPTAFEQESVEQDECISLDRSLIVDDYGLDIDTRLISIERHGIDTSWFEQFWCALRSGISTLWNALHSGVNWIFGFHTPAVIPTHLSDEGQRLMESLTMMANAGKITLGTVAYAMESYVPPEESVELDYEQPQPMYPELPDVNGTRS